MSTGKLILFSNSAEPSLSETEPLVDTLRDIKLIGEPLDQNTGIYTTGENFLQLISFVGCSTNVCLTPTPGADRDFCHITLLGPLDQPTLIMDGNCRTPRCPACKKPMTDWQQQISSQKLKCVHCNKELQLDEISWGRQAGYGRIFIEVSNIFPGEARPTHILLGDLSRATATEWNYFYTGQ